MNIHPTESPIYGGGIIFFNVGKTYHNDDEKFYLVFCGTQIRHVTPAVAIWKEDYLQLQSHIPGHSSLEEVEVTAYRSCCGSEGVVAAGGPLLFRYGSDSAHRMAAFLASSVDEAGILDDLELICREQFQLNTDVQANLDEKLTAAFKALQLPPCWNVMGTKHSDTEPAESLVHFSARLGLFELCAYLLDLPGGLECLSVPNPQRFLPQDLASRNNFHNLAHFLNCCRKSGSSSYISSFNKNSPTVVSTNLSWSTRDLEYDISEVERLIKGSELENSMKDFTPNGVSEPKSMTNGEDSACFDQSSAVSTADQPTQVRVLEDNLIRLRGIHESIQNLRQINAKQIAEHSGKSGSCLSHSCPALSPAILEQDARDSARSVPNMRNFLLKASVSSTNSRSLDSSLFDPINVKIRINDVTPSSSHECLLLPPAYGEHSRPVNTTIGGTASRRLAKKGPIRRQSWSSLGGSASQGSFEERQPVQRRWSLSSLDSDAEEIFPDDVADCSGETPDDVSLRSSLGRVACSHRLPSAKEKNLLRGSTEELSISKSSKQSVSVPSIHNFSSVEIKENLEPLKSNEDTNTFVTLRNAPLQKSLSTPSITVENDREMQLKVKQEASNRQSMCIMQPSSSQDTDKDFSSSIETEDCAKTILFQPVSLAGVLRESQRLPPPATDSGDEEKPFSKRKKRSSIFFKKKPDKHKAKESKKTPHQFMMCQGSSMNCDVCHKPFVKKQALRCENCLVIVHDSSCKDQVIDCNKFKLQSAQAKPSYLPVSKDSSVLAPSINSTSWRLPHYPNRYLHLVRPLSQSMGHLVVSQNKSSQHVLHEKYGLPHFHGFQVNSGIPSLSEAATRSSFISLGKMTSEDNDGFCDASSNMTEINSASMESLDEGAVEISDLEDNHILRLTDDEPETWNATVDKKILKKLNSKEVKKQEAIYELIITEKHHCLNLQIMQKVYVQGLMKEVNMSRDTIDKLFPCLPELLEFHMTLLTRLRERQSKSSTIEHVADILEEQFNEQRAEQIKAAYGQFCSQHLEALNMYKEWIKSDRKFQNFIKKCSTKRFCRTRGIPEYLLLVTQRITKYILVIESLIKAAKDNKEEYQSLTKALKSVKDIIFQVDVQVAEKAKELRLIEIFNKMDPKTAIYYRGKKFKKSDLIANSRKLTRDGSLTWRSPRGKTIDVVAVMVSDFIFFLHENNQKFVFASLENKPGIVSLQKLLVRKKAGADSRGMYLISSNPNEPEMIELFCHTHKDQKAWMDAVRDAVDQCPNEAEGIPSETEEERKMDAARDARVKELLGLLHERDMNVAHLCEDRIRLMQDMLEVIGVDGELYENSQYSQLVDNECGPETRDFLAVSISNASRLANSLYASGTNLSRSVSSAGEHQSDNYVSPLLPKRAETFGGFDNPSKEPVMPSKVPALKKKLLHLKEHASEGVGFLPLKMKINEEFELSDSLEGALRGFDSKTRSHCRPYSISRSRDKHQNQKTSGQLAQNSLPSYCDMSSELIRINATPLLISQGKEQLMQIVELAHHLNNIACTMSHYASTVESLKVQLTQSNEKIAKLRKEKEIRDRRPMYRPEHQLEELRNLQKQLNHDRAVWQQEKTQHETELKSNREELERLQEQLKTEQLDVTHQRELLYRKLDALQKQGIILSPSHTVLNNYIARDTDAPKDEARSAQFPTEANLIPAADAVQHRRTFSFDSQQDSKDLYGNSSTVVTRSDSRGRPLSSSSLPANSSKVVPTHLLNSATNLQKRQSISSQPMRQQLPLKLAANNSSAGTIGAFVHVPQMPQQVLPLKLALGFLPSNIPTFLEETLKSSSAAKRSHSAASSPSSTLTAPVHVRGGSSPALVTYPPNISMSPSGGKVEGAVFHQVTKLSADKTKNKKRDSNEEIFC